MRNLTGANRVLTPIVLASCEVQFALPVRKIKIKRLLAPNMPSVTSIVRSN